MLIGNREMGGVYDLRVRAHHHEAEADPTPEVRPEPRGGGASACGSKEGRWETEQERDMKLTYPSREEAKRYRHEIQEAVEAARKGEEPERNAPAWPAGLDRTILRGLPLPAHSRNCLLRARLMEGDNALTVAEMLRIPGLGSNTVRNLLIGIDEFLGEYIETFDQVPGPADVATMRLTKEVQRLTPTESVIVDERVLQHPPTEYHTLAMRFAMSSSRIRSRLVNTQDRFEIALGPELRVIAAGLLARLGPSPSEQEVKKRIDELLPIDAGCVGRRVRRLFVQALLEEVT